MNLRPYQQEIARAVLDSVTGGKGLTLSVEIARQGGKNELSAHIELLLLTLSMAGGGTIVKCSPTFRPQAVISMERLKQRLEDFGFGGLYRVRMGYGIELGAAAVLFLSAEGSSSVVGHTADLLLEIDEAQDVSGEKYSKEFRPMASAGNATTVLYGTPWDSRTLLEELKQENLERERSDGARRHFSYDWREVGSFNPDYLSFVEAEKQRLGEEHPLFRTQYALLPIPGEGALLSRQQIALLLGAHRRVRGPEGRKVYLAGIDLAGEGLGGATSPVDGAVAGAGGGSRRSGSQRERDSTVLSIAELEQPDSSLPSLKVVEQYRWTGSSHSELYPRILHIVGALWNCRRVVVDATGMGQPVASFLKKELGSRVLPFTFTARSKSELGFELLSFVDSGRLKLYGQDGSPEYRETLLELERARADYRPNRTMTFYVDPRDGHDDFLTSLALLVAAAHGFRPRHARGVLSSE